MRPLLSPRCQEVLEWMARGKTSAEIGLKLGISKMTVKNHARCIHEKLGTSNRISAVVEAVRRGLIILDMPEAQIQVAQVETVPFAPEPKPEPKPIFILEGITVYDNFEVEIGVTNPRRDIIHKRPYELLRFLADPVGRLHARQAILDAVWGPSVFVEERTVDVHVGRLRKFLSDCPYAIKSERALGYHLVHL